MATKKTVTVEMPTSIPKKKVIRFEVEDPDNSTDAVKNVYVSNAAVKALGNPDGIKITIEAL